MKIVGELKKPETSRKKPISIQLSSETIDGIERLAKTYKIAKQRLIDLILQQALKSKDFTINLNE